MQSCAACVCVCCARECARYIPFGMCVSDCFSEDVKAWGRGGHGGPNATAVGVSNDMLGILMPAYMCLFVCHRVQLSSVRCSARRMSVWVAACIA